MKVLTGSFETWDPSDGSAVVTLGVFDGVHQGHRRLIEQAFAVPGIKTIITFDPHPVEVLAPGTSPRLITTLDERLSLLGSMGVEQVAVLDLAEVRLFSPQEFVDQVLVAKLKTVSLTIGSDFHFGKDRAGDVAFLTEAGRSQGFEVDVAELMSTDGQIVSSSRIRSLIEVGSVGDAARLLSSRYQMTNEVVQGDRRGRELGYPTANLNPVPRKVIPGDGVYATVVEVGGTRHMAATNVGTRPTFGGGQRVIEAHILDFDDEIYGEDLTVSFVERLRPELEFKTVDELVSHMDDDVARSRRILESVIG